MKKAKDGFYAVVIKRLFDIIISGLVLIVFCWLFAIVALLVKINLGSPVIYKQDRPGQNEKIFQLYKFRSMKDLKDKDGKVLSDEERLTPFGKKLRSTSLDELPEFWNILKGDMSFVGPRPWLVDYLKLYTDEQHHRHDVKPGLTGWAQVHGRNTSSWDERIRNDLYYVENISFGLDVKTIFLTIAPFLRREGISSGTSETCEAFTGTKQEEQ